MKSSPAAFALMGALLVAFGSIPAQARHHSGNVNIHTDDDQEVTSCNQLNMTFDSRPAIRAEEQLPVSGLRSLHLAAAENGGIHVVGWDRPDYAVTACKAASPDSAGDLDRIRVSLAGDHISATGPNEPNSDWVVYFLVRAPRQGNLEMEASNGPIGIEHAGGTISANAMNGPISLKDISGKISATTENGPISVSGGSGELKLRAQNGPISVKLANGSWDGVGLDARTENGPLSLKIPAAFRSSVLVEASDHSPFSCRGAVCGHSRRTWSDSDDVKELRIGDGAPVVHMSTMNGPVSVKSDQ